MNYIDIRTTIDYMALRSFVAAMKRGKTTLRADLFPKLKFNDQPIEVEIVEKKKE